MVDALVSKTNDGNIVPVRPRLQVHWLLSSRCPPFMVFACVARFVLRRRLPILFLVLCLFGICAYTVTKMEPDYRPVPALPEQEPVMMANRAYEKDFGLPATVLVLGIKDRKVFQLDHFLRFQRFMHDLEQVKGVDKVLSFTHPPRITKSTEKKKFILKPFFTPPPTTQQELDSLTHIFLNDPLYEGQLHNPQTGAVLSMLVFDDDVFFTREGDRQMEKIFGLVEKIEKETDISVDYSGVAYFRYLSRINLEKEIRLFVVVLSVLSLLVLFLIFRSFHNFLPALLLLLLCVPLIISLVVWFGYKMGLFFTLVLPIAIIVCVTNYVYFTNCYGGALSRLSRWRAILFSCEKVGPMLFFANFTTAIGFFALAIVDNLSIRQFGVITGCSVMLSFTMSLITLPLFFSFIPFSPSQKEKGIAPSISALLRRIQGPVMRHPKRIVLLSLGAVLLSAFGFLRIEPVSRMGDYLALNKKAEKGLNFVEENFGGVMPLEVIVDTQKERGVYDLKNMKKVERLQKILDNQPYCSPSLSFVNFLKAATQAFYNGDEALYKVPSRSSFPFINRYLAHMESSASEHYGVYIDKEKQKYRISTRTKNVGSRRLSWLLNDRIRPQIDTLLQETPLRATVTGPTTLLVQRNNYLVGGFARSMLLAFLAVAISISILLRRFRLIYISLITSFIPLFIMAGIIGCLGLRVTPNMILTFTISFGISVDNSIHFLSHYNTEKMLLGRTREALIRTLSVVGPNMIQATIILFFSFGFFVLSSFESIAYFGLLVSLTLIFTTVSNLTFLPAVLSMKLKNKQRP